MSAILGAKQEAERGPITGDTRYSPIFDPANFCYRFKIEIGDPFNVLHLFFIFFFA